METLQDSTLERLTEKPETYLPSVAEILGELSRLITRYALPQPFQITVRHEGYIQMHLSSSAQVDAWAAQLGLTPYCQEFNSGSRRMWGYNITGTWSSCSFGAHVHHEIPVVDERPAVSA